MKQYPIPDWLAPRKNEWLSAGAIGKVFTVDGKSAQNFISERRDSGVLGGRRDDRGFVYYQVKRVYAAARAHNVPIDRVDQEELSAVQQLAICRTRLDSYEKDLDSQRAQIIDNVLELKELRGRIDDVVAALSCLPAETDQRGVYFVFGPAGVAYIGSADNVRSRLSHPAFGLIDVRVLPVGDTADHREIEEVFIRLLRPPMNKMHNPDRRKAQ